MRGAVVDLSFAHTKDKVAVGVVDSMGNLFVHKVMDTKPSRSKAVRGEV